MFSRIINISPQGQITIPKVIRRRYVGKKFLLEVQDEIIILKPCNVVVKYKNLVLEKLVTSILSLTNEERLVYEILRKAPCSTDSLIEQSSFGISKINVILVTLQFSHLIRKRRDCWYEAVLPIE